MSRVVATWLRVEVCTRRTNHGRSFPHVPNVRGTVVEMRVKRCCAVIKTSLSKWTGRWYEGGQA